MLAKLQNPKILMSTALILLLIGIVVGFIIGLTSSGSTEERYIALDSGGAIINSGDVYYIQQGSGKQTLETLLPTTLLEAKNNGWIEQSSCIANKGKYFVSKLVQNIWNVFTRQNDNVEMVIASSIQQLLNDT